MDTPVDALEKNASDEFFAVTLDPAVWHISSKKDLEGTPTVERIAQISGGPIPVGGRLAGGKFVGIGGSGIVLYVDPYSPRKRRRPEEVETIYWGGYTPPIVALCLQEGEALMCLHSKELQVCDSRWREETEEVLKYIGNDHPVFVLSAKDPIRFA